MIDIKIILNKLTMPKPKPKKKKCGLAMVEQLIEDVDHPEKGELSWKRIKNLFEELSEKKDRTHKENMILKKLSPVIRRYKQYDNDGVKGTTEFITEE